MNNYPDEWNIKTLDEVCSRIWIGLVTTMTKFYVKKGIKLIRNSDITKNGIDINNLIQLDPTFSNKHNKYLVKTNDVVTIHTGDVGTSCVIPKELSPAQGFATINSRLNRQLVLPEFYSTYLNSDFFKNQVQKVITGDGRSNLNLKDFIKLMIAFPPLPEQKKITEILSGIDKLKQCCNDEIKKIDLVEKSLWSELFPEEENDEWRKITVSEIGTVIRGASPRPKGDPRYYGGNVPRLMVADVTRDGKKVIPNIDFLTEEGAKLSRPVPAGTLTIVCSGVVGVPSILSVPACIHDGFLAIKDISKSCLTEYLYYYFKPLQSRLDSSATHGGIFTNLTTEILKNFPVMIPSLRKQKEICEILNTIDCYRDSLLKKKEKIQFLFNGVSSELLTGRKRVDV